MARLESLRHEERRKQQGVQEHTQEEVHHKGTRRIYILSFADSHSKAGYFWLKCKLPFWAFLAYFVRIYRLYNRWKKTQQIKGNAGNNSSDRAKGERQRCGQWLMGKLDGSHQSFTSVMFTFSYKHLRPPPPTKKENSEAYSQTPPQETPRQLKLQFGGWLNWNDSRNLSNGQPLSRRNILMQSGQLLHCSGFLYWTYVQCLQFVNSFLLPFFHIRETFPYIPMRQNSYLSMSKLTKKVPPDSSWHWWILFW